MCVYIYIYTHTLSPSVLGPASGQDLTVGGVSCTVEQSTRSFSPNVILVLGTDI